MVLQLVLGKTDEAAIIAALLVFNAVVSFRQEGRANKALALLRKRLNVQARVLRDGHWGLLPARELVPGYVVHLRMGDLVPADVTLVDGQVQLDHPLSPASRSRWKPDLLVGPIPVYRSPGRSDGGGLGNRGTHPLWQDRGVGTYGEDCQSPRKPHLHHRQVPGGGGCHLGRGVARLCPGHRDATGGCGSLRLDSAGRVGSRGIASHVHPGHGPGSVRAVEAWRAGDTALRGRGGRGDGHAGERQNGTITENRLTMAALESFPPCDRDELLRLAALACDEATQDPIDLAILSAARERSLLAGLPPRRQFIPFDPLTRRSEAVFEHDGETRRALKGAPQVIAALVRSAPEMSADIEQFASQGYRVLAVASGDDSTLHLALGLVALQDPPRVDSAALVRSLRDLGVRVVMMTGDDEPTALAVADRVGIGTRACPSESLRQNDGGAIAQYDVFARVFPEDKFRLVQALQHAGHVVGMTGDGVNDAPALKQAEVGIAVANATDVAKAAASMVLTNPGLTDVVAAVETSRRIYQRMLTYTLNKIIKTLEIAVFLSVGVMLAGVFAVMPMLIVLLLFTNDFVTMSIATDHVQFSPSRSAGASQPCC